MLPFISPDSRELLPVSTVQGLGRELTDWGRLLGLGTATSSQAEHRQIRSKQIGMRFQLMTGRCRETGGEGPSEHTTGNEQRAWCLLTPVYECCQRHRRVPARRLRYHDNPDLQAMAGISVWYCVPSKSTRDEETRWGTAVVPLTLHRGLGASLPRTFGLCVQVTVAATPLTPVSSNQQVRGSPSCPVG